jgi:pimeloyl-ACP methyl ester carboxylesterase
MRKAVRVVRRLVVGVVLVLLVVLVAAWATRARWLPYAIAGAPNAGKTPTQLDEGDSLPTAATGGSRDLRVEVGRPRASLSVRILEPAGDASDAANATNAAKGTIFVLHGIRDSKRSMAGVGEAFRRAGYRAVLVDLRGHGRSTGDWLSFGDREGRDLKEVADALAVEGVLALPLGVYGPSYGGAAALQMARRDPRVKAVVTVATYTRMRDIVPLYAERVAPSWLLTNADVSAAIDRAGVLGDFHPDDADSVAAIASTAAEVLLIHGRADANIPWQQSESLHDAASSHSRLLVLDGLDHRTIMNDATVVRESVAWFDQHLSH